MPGAACHGLLGGCLGVRGGAGLQKRRSRLPGGSDLPEALPPSACTLGAHLPELSCHHGPEPVWTLLPCLESFSGRELRSHAQRLWSPWDPGAREPIWGAVGGEAMGARHLQGRPGTPKRPRATGHPLGCEPLVHCPGLAPLRPPPRAPLRGVRHPSLGTPEGGAVTSRVFGLRDPPLVVPI